MKIVNIFKNLITQIKSNQTDIANINGRIAIREVSPSTLNSNAVSSFKCYQFGKVTTVSVLLKSGVSDQTSLATGLPIPEGSSNSGGRITLAPFCMNATDIPRDFMAYINEAGSLESRCASTSAGSSGIYLSCTYISK